ncbi:MAG TPA: TIGR03084 family metal-binding protein [Rugosimonospora sp.]|nr:TIGR03084 family metal-binding protein [Rugosimonospora sp.]
MADLVGVLTDLRDEAADLDRLVAGLDADGWALPTPAPGWTIAHQIAHLAWTDEQVVLAATDPREFQARMVALTGDPMRFVDDATRAALAPPGELLARWRDSRSRVAEALVGLPAGARHPWFGTELGAVSSATARLMETWAHGEDVAAAVGTVREPTVRLRHVAYLGWRTCAHSFRTHGRPGPTAPVYVELTAPDGGTWAYGPPDAQNRVLGPAIDFCLLVVQRTHRADTALEATGPVADEWLDIAQAFAGPPGEGRPAGSAGPPGEGRPAGAGGPPGGNGAGR